MPIFNVNVLKNPFQMSVRGGLPPSICSQIQKVLFRSERGGQHFLNNSEIRKILNYP